MKLTLNYKHPQDYLPTDISQLRPQGSYKQLISKRNHPIEHLIATYGKIPEDLLIQRACPTCGITDSVFELEKDYMSLVKCQACALIYVNPIFDEHHYQEIYRSQDYQTIVKNLGESSHTYRVERFGTERVQIMQEYHRSPNTTRYLDVGCSTGFVVEAAQNAGWEAFGIDLNPSAIEFGRARGLNLQNTSLEQCDFSAASFDIISLFDVLEHLPNPKEILSQAMHLLKPGGIVFLYVPNYDSASRILMGKDAHFIWPTHHLNYYTPATISDFLARLGLAVEFLSTEGLDIADYLWWRQDQGHAVDGLEPIADSLQFFINAGGYGKNLRILARR